MIYTFLDILNQYTSAIQAFSSLIIMTFTIGYVIISKKMLKEIILNRIKEESPNVNLRFIQNPVTMLYIELSNISKVEVYDLKFTEFPKNSYGSNIIYRKYWNL